MAKVFQLDWWRLKPGACSRNFARPSRVAKQYAEWGGVYVLNMSGMEQRMSNDWIATLPADEVAVMRPECFDRWHPITGRCTVQGAEFYFCRDEAIDEFLRFLSGMPERRNEFEVGPTAPPAIRTALRGLNWHIGRGDKGRVLTVQDTDRLMIIGSLAALTKA